MAHLSLNGSVWHHADVEDQQEPVDVEAPVRQHPLLVLALQPQLVLADVHQLLGRAQLGGRATLDVGLGLAGAAEGLEGGVVDEFCLLHNL